MNKRDDYLSSTSPSKTISGTSDKCSTNEVITKESAVPENARYVLDDILKDQLIYDPDDIPLFEIEAAEFNLLEDIRQQFEIDSEENSLIEEIRRHFGIDTTEDSSIEYLKCRFGADSEENGLSEGIRQHLSIDANESTSVVDIKPGFGTYEGENNSAEGSRLFFEIDPPDEDTLKGDVRDVLNNILRNIGLTVSFDACFDDEELVPDIEIPVTLSNDNSKNKSLFPKKLKSIEFQPPLHSKNFIRNCPKTEKRVYSDEPRTSIERMERRKSECSTSKTLGISPAKTRGTVSCSNTPRVSIYKKDVDELRPFFSAKEDKDGFNWRQCTELLDVDNVDLDIDREICSNEFYRPNKHFEKKASKHSVTKNKKVSAEQNDETIQRKSDASSSVSLKVTVPRETVEKPCHFLKAKLPEKSYVSLPIPSDVIVSKETVPKTCYSESKTICPTSFQVTNLRETAQETCRSVSTKHLIKPEEVSSPTPRKVSDFKEFSTEDKQFDWQKWLEAYDSDEDKIPSIPKFRVIKRGRQHKNICNKCLCLFTFCLCAPRARKKKNK